MTIHKSIITIVSFALFILGCENAGHSTSQSSFPYYSNDRRIQKEGNQKMRNYNIRDSKGVVVAQIGSNISRRLSLYESNGQAWLTLSFDGNLKRNLPQLQPFAKNAETYLLAFNCVGVANGYYKVVVNEENKNAKYIKVNDKGFKLKTWQEYILTCFSVDTDSNSNPIRNSPSLGSKMITYDKDEFYHPVKCQGNWVQLKWGEEGSWKYGWVQWKKDSTLIIELFNNA